LSLEALEGRATPAGVNITSMSGQIIGSHVVVTGQVQDETPDQVTINLSGSVSGTVQADRSGAFEFISSTTDSSLNVSAQATDGQGLISPLFQIYVSPSIGNQAPYVTMSVSYGSQRSVTLSGTVYDESPAGLPVSIWGMVASQTVYTDSNGNFTLTAVASGLGDVCARATDVGGLLSNIAKVTLTSNAPRITDMVVSCQGQNTYVLTGRVIEESPGGLTFTLGGEVNAFRGQQVTVASDGTFSVTVTITDPTDRGQITAQVTDWWGLTSDVTSYLFS
jgi:hypothetical protein